LFFDFFQKKMFLKMFFQKWEIKITEEGVERVITATYF